MARVKKIFHTFFLLSIVLLPMRAFGYGELIQHDQNTERQVGFSNSAGQYKWAMTFTPDQDWDISSFGIKAGYASGGSQPSDNLKADLCTYSQSTGTDDPCDTLLDTLTIAGSSTSETEAWFDEDYDATLTEGTVYVIKVYRTGANSVDRYTLGESNETDDGAGGSSNVAEGDSDSAAIYYSSGDITDWNWMGNHMSFRVSGSVNPQAVGTKLTMSVTDVATSTVTVGGTCNFDDLTDDEYHTDYLDYLDSIVDPDETDPPILRVYTYRGDQTIEDWVAFSTPECDTSDGTWSLTVSNLADGFWTIRAWQSHYDPTPESGTSSYTNFTNSVGVTIIGGQGTLGQYATSTPIITFGALDEDFCDADDTDDEAFMNIICYMYNGITSRPPFSWIGQLTDAFQRGWYGEGESLNLTLDDPNDIFDDIVLYDSSATNTGITGLINTWFPQWNTWGLWIIYGAGIFYVVAIPRRFMRNLNPEDAP